MKKRITALGLAIFMVMGTVAMAAGAEKAITVSPMSLTVDGQVVTPTKSDGTAAEVFAYEGATYAPLRFLAEQLGYTVDWNAENSGVAAVSKGLTYADTIAWDGEYDVVVVGFGGAGSVASITAADEGASVLLTEKAPEGHEGGNTRYCGQVIVYGEDYETIRAHYEGLNAGRSTPAVMLDTYAAGISQIPDIVANITGLPKDEFVLDRRTIQNGVVEYPELPGGDKMTMISAHEALSDAYIWNALRGQVLSRDNIDVWFESPGTKLIQDPVSRTVLGVTIDRKGESVNIRAKNGVVLACGGFENNAEMVENYLGLLAAHPLGTTYNTGDGIKMAMEVGAKLWHMRNSESMYTTFGFAVPQGERSANLPKAYFSKGSIIWVGQDGSRYLPEDGTVRHGKVYHCGTYMHPHYADRTFAVYDQAHADLMRENHVIPATVHVYQADTLEALAELTGMLPETLKGTVENFNAFAQNGEDLQLGRAAVNMTALSATGPYYAVEMEPVMLNTQGGPQRNENAQVLDVNDTPIPHLYSAGELGGIAACQYQAGGNMAECFVFGQIAGKNAAAVKNDELPVLTAVSSSMKYAPGAASDIAKTTHEISLGANEYMGVSHNGIGGDVYVKVTMSGGKIIKVEVLDNNETPGIGDKAIAALPDAIVAAGSTEVDNVSGATTTSKAIKEAVANALAQVK